MVNKLHGGIKVAAETPGFGDNRKATLQDIGIITGGIVVSEEMGHSLENISIDQLDCAKQNQQRRYHYSRWNRRQGRY